MLAKTARINAELNFVEVESEKKAQLKRIGLLKELAATRAELEVVSLAEERADLSVVPSEN